jgi:hypothetical protein
MFKESNVGEKQVKSRFRFRGKEIQWHFSAAQKLEKRYVLFWESRIRPRDSMNAYFSFRFILLGVFYATSYFISSL